ncbi:hypothetical protein CY34DRAFT_800915 [Suillus luteus UH-Slu-Lm8-n1]|uniref:Uncharacterized protein n=1 Tax=Suillus luteus UH-Slu-Lm8-n1 TaxID=930992 RepID=A0A0D0A7I5_9AGAM|nr:hypothetical protein CY34DRAFT_800915 [Suillus luteus UH-Slu-Lm8-n1]
MQPFLTTFGKVQNHERFNAKNFQPRAWRRDRDGPCVNAPTKSYGPPRPFQLTQIRIRFPSSSSVPQPLPLVTRIDSMLIMLSLA